MPMPRLNLPNDSIVADYEAGKSAREIARRVGCSCMAIIRRLNEAGVETHSRNPITRFWSHVNKHGPVPTHQPQLGHCWVWTGAIYKSGYGLFSLVSGSTTRAHRFANFLAHGPVPKGLLVCHHCDNRICVRDSHLFRGTQKQNMADAISKSRLAVGERNGNSRFTRANVMKMREAFANGEPMCSLQKRFTIDRTQLAKILRGKLWPHAAGPIVASVCRAKTLISVGSKSKRRTA